MEDYDEFWLHKTPIVAVKKFHLQGETWVQVDRLLLGYFSSDILRITGRYS